VFQALFRHVFALVVCLSAVLHAALVLFVWLFFTSDTLPQVVSPQRGRFSIALQAMKVEAKESDDPNAKEVRPTPPLDRTQQPRPTPVVEPDDTPPSPVVRAMMQPLRPTEFRVPPEIERPRAPTPEGPPEPQPSRKVKPDKTDAPLGPRPSPSSLASDGSDVEELPTGSVTNPIPPYPAELLAARIEGKPTLRVLVGANGRAKEVTVHRSSGYRAFDESARDTVLRRWRFIPAKRKGVAVDCEVLVPVVFYMER